MTTVTVRYQVCRGHRSVPYVCLECDEKKTKSFTVEHTVNPFNKDELGHPKNADQVRRDATKEADEMARQFLRHPVCAKCEDSMSREERQRIRAIRQSV